MTADPVEAMLPAAAALAVAVCERDATAVAEVLTPLTHDDLLALTIALAANVDLDQPLTTDPTMPEPEDVATRAVNIAGELFATDAMHILSTARGRNVLDARAAAMYACRLVGLSSPYIGARFNRDHSTVLYACARVGESPKLRAAGRKIAVQCGWKRDQDEEAS